jgi:hypothetical protein
LYLRHVVNTKIKFAKFANFELGKQSMFTELKQTPMKNLIIIITTIICSLTLNSCDKKTPAPTTDANGLPFATQTGANTFGCLIDGVPCSVSGEYNWLYTYGVDYSLALDSTFNIKAITNEPSRKDFYFLGHIGKLTIGTHNANQFVDPGFSSLNINGGATGGSYYANTNLPATIEITKYTGDRTKGVKKGDIISGTFDMILQNADEKKLHLTKGRFDITCQ